jgi:bifunctional DNA-binding transcriptional regulator/antitoxin component of YhaV-PrlF toxin-antitoxin module
VAIRDGRTSSEFRMTRRYSEELARLGTLGASETGTPEGGGASHEELAVLDRAGRLQIPREYLDALGVGGRGMMRVELEDGRIVLMPKEPETGPVDGSDSVARKRTI